jgi:hypothetical protein
MFEQFIHQHEQRLDFGDTFSLARRPAKRGEPIRRQSSAETPRLLNIFGG